MEKIDDPLQNDFGTLSQNIGLKQEKYDLIQERNKHWLTYLPQERYVLFERPLMANDSR